MSKPNWIIGALLFTSFILITLKPMANPDIKNWLTGRSYSSSDTNLALENQELKSNLAILQNLAQILPKTPVGAKLALVYARDPFNLKDEWTLTLGRVDGITLGSGVTLLPTNTTSTTKSPGVLIGKIKKVFNDTSLVQTIFDSNWKTAVKIGPDGVDALLVGGNEPKVTLIAKNATTTPGMAVYAASNDLPYGLAIGEVSAVSPSPDQLFREASLKLPYDVNDINSVFILPNNER